MKRILKWFLLIATAALVAAPVVADDTTTTTATEQLGPPGGPYPSKVNPQYPRDNAKSAAVTSRRPGIWTAAGVSRTSKRQDLMLKQYGGATIPPATSQPSAIKTALIVAAIDQAFKTLNQLLTQWLADLAAGSTSTTTESVAVE